MRILLIDNGSGLFKKLQELIPGDEIVCAPENIDEVDITDIDLIVLSGSKDLTVVYDSEYFQKEIELIKNTPIPLIGICFGCELIATTFGGTLKRLEERHSGLRAVTSLSNNETLNLQEGCAYRVYEGHRWAIDIMPENFEILAKSSDGPEIIRHTDRPIWGFQFHPENLVEQTTGDEMFLNLFSKLTQK